MDKDLDGVVSECTLMLSSEQKPALQSRILTYRGKAQASKSATSNPFAKP